MAERLDLVVIGSGGAAMAAGIEARRRGRTVLLVEQGALGGTCLNVGCVPSKTLLAAVGERARAMRNTFSPGVVTQADAVNLPALVAQKQALVDRLRQAKYVEVAAAHGFAVRTGRARFAGPDLLRVDGERVAAGAYVIATGAQPALPPLPGLEQVSYLTSTTAMEQQDLPTSMVIIGAGHAGLEQAQLWARAGVRVTLVGRFAPYVEPELATVLREALAEDGVTVVVERAARVAAGSGEVTVTTGTGACASAERLLVATGRRPRTDGLGLGLAGVATDERGFIAVDAQQRTSNPSVYAAGDVSGAPQYVYVAARTGHAAAANALGDTQEVDYSGLPSVTFTSPQLASVGLTEAQAIAAGHRCECRVLDAHDIPRALVTRDTRGVLKVVASADTGQVLGVHAALDGGGELMLAASMAIRTGMTVSDLADTWAPYLTMNESLRLAAGMFLDDKPTSCCA